MSTFELLLSLFFVMMVGFVCGRVKFLDKAAYKALTRFVFYIATSALIIQAVSSINVSDFNKFPRFILANCVIVIVGYLLVYVALRLSRVGYKTGASILFAGNVANSIYLGLPLIKILYGAEGLLYAIAFLAIPLTAADILGFYILSQWRFGKTSIGSVLRDFFKNPIVISTAVGLLLLMLKVHLPAFIITSLDLLGVTATGLALFATGLFLSIFITKRFNLRSAVMTSFVKLIFIPAVALVIGKYIFALSGTPLFVTVMLAAMPSAIFSLIVATEYNFDERKTADAILLSSVLFLITSTGWTAILR
ncbi:MAG TPA: AEC family transporter [Candidatus Limnocylindrales bacterium]|nr:AEC family transporter [Candidatus Limnocylindrales bacterium]